MNIVICLQFFPNIVTPKKERKQMIKIIKRTPE